MLERFTVQNFKAFQEQICLNLGNPGNYEFNEEAIYQKENVVSKAIIYGFNGCGKSSLGLAIFDIILHLTDKEKGLDDYEPYLNLSTKEAKPATFEYRFRFGSDTLTYKYQKMGLNLLLNESVRINEREVIQYDFQKHNGKVLLKGTETLQISVGDNQISRVKYISSNAILKKNRENEVFLQFIDFVNHMLMFYSLDYILVWMVH